MGSSCTTIRFSELQRLNLPFDSSKHITLRGYGQGCVTTLGTSTFDVQVDNVHALITTYVVPNIVQEVPVLIGRNFTELSHILLVKDSNSLNFLNQQLEISTTDYETSPKKIVLRTIRKETVPFNNLGHIYVHSIDSNYEGDILIEASFRPIEGREYCIPRTILQLRKGTPLPIPCINMSDNELAFKANQVFARGYPCEEAEFSDKVLQITETSTTDLPFEDIPVGPVSQEEKTQLFNLLAEYRDCFAQTLEELGCATTTQMDIRLTDDSPFTYRPYRMSRTEQNRVKEIIEELLANDIIRESDSNYCSPILLVKKKNGEERMCIDYRKLNRMTIKDNHPLPRVDDQVDRLQGSVYFTSLDLKSGYHQISLTEESKRYTSFVTPGGQYEYNTVPFGLTNAPRIFQRFMNKVLKPAQDCAAVYLDDVLLHAPTVEESLNNLRKLLDIFRQEGLTLNLKKCSFLMKTIAFLGFIIENGTVKPGKEKTKAIQEFPTPTSVHQIRQFLGLTGYFRHFVKDYAHISRPMTNLTKKQIAWKWTEKEEAALQHLKDSLSNQPVLALYNPEAVTEVRTDASSLGIAGILMQMQAERLHPVFFYSRQTTDTEQKYHSYELETLAVVESLKKFRPYLLGLQFSVITDCNALKATSTKKQIIPRIARWWLQLQEFTFDVKYRPGNRMKHVDALSRNPVRDQYPEILRIEQADWVLSGQLTDQKIQDIHQTLSKPPESDAGRQIYKNYALRDGRTYRITARGIQWVVPRGMRNQVVRAAHDEHGHFGIEKTLHRLSDHYWFPRMQKYVEQYISCCIPCLFNKRASGRREGFLNLMPKEPTPFHAFHIDHLGPFPKSRRGNVHLIVGIDAFTKFAFLKAVKSTKINMSLTICEIFLPHTVSPKF